MLPRPLSDLTEPELLALIDRQRDAVFTEVARRYHERIGKFLLRMVGEPDVAEDLTQDAFMKALEAFREDPPRRKLWEWIYRIANNVGVDYLRSQKREPASLGDDLDPHHTPPGKSMQPAAPPHEPTPTPPLRAKARQLKPEFERAITLLRGHRRYCFVEYYLKGRSYDDIAQSLGLERETVKRQVRSAREEMKRVMEDLPKPKT